MSGLKDCRIKLIPSAEKGDLFVKIKLSNYIAQFLVTHGITNVFTVTGGGAMHLNDAFGHQKGLNCLYNHHEQACAIAAESYARIHNKIALVCVTTGPGGTNALTGVLGGWLDSIPMLIISGQVRYDTTARSTGLPLRAMGDQEFDICRAVASMTKYCEMVIDPLKIKYCLERALHEAQNGRPGPCWLDIPLNVQGAFIETDELFGYNPKEFNATLPPPVSSEVVNSILERIKCSERPILYAGNGVRLSGGFEVFQKVVDKLNIPVVTCFDSIDAIYDEHPLYVGRSGIMGDRAGNFAVQNSDLIFSVGNRLSIRQVGYNYKTWAQKAFVIANDIDENELKKPTLHVEMPVWADAADLLDKLNAALSEGKFFRKESWLECCHKWKTTYPVVQEKQFAQRGKVNVYAFIKSLSEKLPEGQITVVGNGSACVVGSQAYVIKKNQRFVINSGVASMGYDLPAAIGACMASNKAETICVTGDGSIQMNIQELETIAFHKLPIKLFVINNDGYHSIRQTQSNYFGKPLVGIGKDSGDLGFPKLEKLIPAYGLKYLRIEENQTMPAELDKILGMQAPFVCEVFVDTEQIFEPKVAAKKLPDGTMISATLENMSPFLPEEELNKNLFVGKGVSSL